MATPPSTNNLSIFKATITFEQTGDAAPVDLGEVMRCDFTPSVERLPYFSNRSGIRKKIKEVIVEAGGTITLVMSEVVAYNLAMLVGGTITEDTVSGNDSIDILAATSGLTGVLTVTGTNDIGTKLTAVFNVVTFFPTGTVAFITNEWAEMEVEGEVLADASGDFGTITVIEAA